MTAKSTVDGEEKVYDEKKREWKSTPNVSDLFAVHRLSESGLDKANKVKELFEGLLKELNELIPGEPNRQYSLLRTKLEEACFFAKKCVAMDEVNHFRKSD